MLQRSCSAVRLLLLLILFSRFSASLRSQNIPSGDNGRVFRANAQIVILDVTVTGKNGVPVAGLHKEDFQVAEDGHPQTIASFEEHSGSRPAQASLPALPPNVFSNIPRTKLADSVTVLLLDSLNTPLADQARVRLQTLKFLKTLQPGQKLAIFGLNSQLRFIQGFTDDPALLAAAIDRKARGAHVQSSPLLGSNAETAAAQETAAAMRAAPGGEGEDAAEALEQFMADQNAARSDERLRLTLEAFQELAHYLGGLPGRKNVAWFSGAFPVVLLPDVTVRDANGPQRDDQQLVRKTDALLASAQVAIYPISAEGVATGSFYSPETDVRQNQQQVNVARQSDLVERLSAHSAMDEIAKYTGGKAFYNTNGLQEALADVTNNGSHYYTLTYSSPNQATDGRYRKIKVKLTSSPGYQLDYRQGYYADDGKSKQAAAASKSAGSEALSSLMRRGLPDSTQIPLTVQVLRNTDQRSAVSDPTQPVPNQAQPGGTPVLTGPLRRYTVHFFIAPGGLLFDQAPDGHRRLSVDAALLVYDHDGKLLNRVLRQIDLEMDAAQYAIAVANGVNFRLPVDAPSNAYFLRSGVYDLKSNLAGTLEVPLNRVGP